MVIKVKEITIGGGGKISRGFQSVPYPCKVTVTGEDGDKPSKMIKKAIKLLAVVVDTARENAEKELELLVRRKEESEKASIVRNDINKPSKALPKRANEEQFKKETVEVTEAIIMSPNEVTVRAGTPKSLLVTKKGYQKWIAFSLMEGISEGDYKIGEYIEEITIIAEREKWFNEVKGWDKLEVRKG